VCSCGKLGRHVGCKPDRSMRRPRWTFLKSLACAAVLIACGEEVEEATPERAPTVALASDPPETEDDGEATGGRMTDDLEAHRQRLEAAAMRADLRFGGHPGKPFAARRDELTSEAR
jgi:hypothetical protein